MTRFEKGKQDIKVLAKMICDQVQIHEEAVSDDFACDACPWTDYCSFEHNGVEAWLNGKVKE